MSGVRVKLLGQRKLKKALSSYDKRTQRAVSKSLKVHSLKIFNDARKKAPVDTGFLRNSIFFKISRFSSQIGASASYASFVEFGTRIHKTLPKPFLTPAFRKWSKEFVKNVKSILKL